MTGRFSIPLAVGLLVFTLGGGTARSAMATASRGGHVGGVGGGVRAGRMFPHGAPASRPLDRRRFGDGRNDRRRFSDVAGVPYDDWYWDDGGYGYEASYGPSRPAAPRHSGYCDVSSSQSYPQNCVWKDGP